MALSFPLSFSLLANCLTGPETSPELVRFDEKSGSGDGRSWNAEMAPPLWQASYELYARTPEMARRINALIYSLDGGQKDMLWQDPYYTGPAAGAKGNLAAATVASIRASDRGALGITGLPPGQVITTGDHFSINHTSGRIYHGVFAEDGTANASGVLAARDVRPYIPFGVNIGVLVELIRPLIRMSVEDFRPFRISRGKVSSTASITLKQKP